VRGRIRPQAFVRAPAVDALLYAGSATAAVLVSAYAPLERNRMWAELAWPTYAAGALVALCLAWRAFGIRRESLSKARLVLALCVLAGAVVVPLAKQVQWRAEGAHVLSAALHPYAASEVVVTEGAAAALLQGRDPYRAYFSSPELVGRSPSIPEHFPYLPGMALFGLPGALVPNSPWTDARVFFALLTGIAAAAALWRWRVPPERRLRALQVLVVLPTGASVLVAGGDDMPVLALSLLALVMFQRGRHAASAAAVAVAALLKVTAWPLLVALAVAARYGRSRRRLSSPFVLAPAVVAVGVFGAVAAGPAAFVDDVLLFPAGLTALPSPAASQTVGAMLTGLVGSSPPGAGRVAVTLALLAVASLVVAAALVVLARGRAGAAEAAAAAGVILLTLVVLAPVARLGYLLYPIDLLVWAALLRPTEAAAPAALRVPVPEALAA
jgi:hypothetical protein